MCWHPVFSAALDLLRIADGMKLTGKNFTLECGFSYDHNSIAGTESVPLSKYLIQSLSSETEFVIDNGQSKLMRLPKACINIQSTFYLQIPSTPKCKTRKTPRSHPERWVGALHVGRRSRPGNENTAPIKIRIYLPVITNKCITLPVAAVPFALTIFGNPTIRSLPWRLLRFSLD